MAGAGLENIIVQLEAIKSKINGNNVEEINNQIDFLERIISRFFADSSYYNRVAIAKGRIMWIVDKGNGFMGNTIEDVKKMANSVIDNMLVEVESFGIPSKDDVKVDKSININNNPSFTQSQTINIELFKDILKDSLTGKQYKELEEIAKQEKESTKAIPKIVDKLKSFGADVASNIVATLITNPHLYTGLF